MNLSKLFTSCKDCMRCLQSEKVDTIVCKMIDVVEMFYKDIYSANDVYKVKRFLRLLDVIYQLQRSCLNVC